MDQMDLQEGAMDSKDLPITDVLRDNFMMALAHDVRNPLHTMTIYTECMLADLYGELNEEQADAIQQLSAASKALTVLVNSVFAMEQWRREDLTPCLSDFDLIKTTKDCVEISTGKADSLKMTLRMEAKNDCLPVRADRDKVQQMIHNVLSTMVRVSENTELVIGVEQRGMDATVSIMDASMTLTEDELDAVVRGAWEKGGGRFGGRILGLAMAKAFCEGHRGEFRVMTGEGGTRMEMRIPR